MCRSGLTPCKVSAHFCTSLANLDYPCCACHWACCCCDPSNCCSSCKICACNSCLVFCGPHKRTSSILTADQFDALGAPDEVVANGAKQGSKEDNERPDYFVIAFRWLFGDAVDEYPDPEDGCKDGNALHPSRKKEEKRIVHASSLLLSVDIQLLIVA